MSIIVRPINLRHTLTLKYNIVSVYREILAHADLPYFFDELNKPWWRYYGQLYGFSYSRIHRSYDLWISNGLKRNVQLYMPFLMRMPSKNINTTNSWKKRTFLYKNTYNNNLTSWHNPRYFKKINLASFNLYNSTKENLYYNFLGNRNHYSENPSGLFSVGNENIFSGFNAKWHSSYKHSAGFYKLRGMAPVNNLVGVNDHYMWTSLFINLYDTTLIMYPQNYLNYYNSIYKKKIIDIIWPFFSHMTNNLINNYNNMYSLILYHFYNILLDIFNKKIKSYFFYCFNLSSIDTLVYRLNLYYFLYIYKFFYKKIIDFNYFINIFNYKNNICLSGLKLNNNLFNFNRFTLNKKQNDVNLKRKYMNYFISNFFNKDKFINLKKLLKLNIKSKLYKKSFPFTKNISQSYNFINIYRGSWTTRFIFYLKNIKILNKIYNFSNDYRNKLYKSYYISKFSLLNYKKKYNLKIKRILSYGKLFLRVPSNLMKRRLGYTKLSSVIANKTLFRTFLFLFFNKNIYNKIAKFTYNVFFIINSLIKMNFGLSYSLLKYNKYNTDNYFYLNIKNYLSKFFIFLNSFINKKKKNNWVKKNYFFYKVFFKLLNYKMAMKQSFMINKLYKNKIKYLNYCYKGILLKIFNKKSKYNLKR